MLPACALRYRRRGLGREGAGDARSGENHGGEPVAARSSPSCMSSTMLPDASDAVASFAHGNAIPVPINWHGPPRRCQPSGRTWLRTAHANSAILCFRPAPGGARIR